MKRTAYLSKAFASLLVQPGVVDSSISQKVKSPQHLIELFCRPYRAQKFFLWFPCDSLVIVILFHL